MTEETLTIEEGQTSSIQYHISPRSGKPVKNGKAAVRFHKNTTRNEQRAKRFGVTVKYLYEIAERQEFMCATCPKPLGRDMQRSGIALDHDHAIGLRPEAIRGFLCADCNWMLRHRKDGVINTTQNLVNLAKYSLAHDKRLERKRHEIAIENEVELRILEREVI